MAVGPREAQRRAMRERGAGGIAVKERAVAVGGKTRTASPSQRVVAPVRGVRSHGEVDRALAAAGSGPPEKPPISAAAAKRGPDGPRKTFLVTIPTELDKRLERTRAERGLRSRNEVVVALLDEGAEK